MTLTIETPTVRHSAVGGFVVIAAAFPHAANDGLSIKLTAPDGQQVEIRASGTRRMQGENGLRPIGLCAGEFTVPDDFDDPLPEDILREFEGL